MNLRVLSGGVFTANELATTTLPPAWRKATRNMVMATLSMQRALDRLPDWLEQNRGHTGLVLGSNSGELETSSDFLLTLARSGLARPLLFQNSLHNATTGFASIHFRLTGPTFSISSGERLPEESLRLAESLVRAQECAACLVTLVEGHKMIADLLDESVAEGAATLLVGSGQGLDETALAPYPTADLTAIDQSSFYRLARDFA